MPANILKANIGLSGFDFSTRIAGKYGIFRKLAHLPALIFLRLFGTGVMNRVTNVRQVGVNNRYIVFYLNIYLKLITQFKHLLSDYSQSQRLGYLVNYISGRINLPQRAQRHGEYREIKTQDFVVSIQALIQGWEIRRRGGKGELEIFPPITEGLHGMMVSHSPLDQAQRRLDPFSQRGKGLGREQGNFLTPAWMRNKVSGKVMPQLSVGVSGFSLRKTTQPKGGSTSGSCDYQFPSITERLHRMRVSHFPLDQAQRRLNPFPQRGGGKRRKQGNFLAPAWMRNKVSGKVMPQLSVGVSGFSLRKTTQPKGGSTSGSCDYQFPPITEGLHRMMVSHSPLDQAQRRLDPFSQSVRGKRGEQGNFLAPVWMRNRVSGMVMPQLSVVVSGFSLRKTTQPKGGSTSGSCDYQFPPITEGLHRMMVSHSPLDQAQRRLDPFLQSGREKRRKQENFLAPAWMKNRVSGKAEFSGETLMPLRNAKGNKNQAGINNLEFPSSQWTASSYPVPLHFQKNHIRQGTITSRVDKSVELIFRKDMPRIFDTTDKDNQRLQPKETIYTTTNEDLSKKTSMRKMTDEINMVADRVYKIIEKRISIEKERRGWR